MRISPIAGSGGDAAEIAIASGSSIAAGRRVVETPLTAAGGA